VADFRNFMGAVIDENAWRKHAAAIEEARTRPDCEIVAGGKTDKKLGYFVDPTLILTSDFESRLLREELFGPIATAFVYDDKDFDELIRRIDATSHYALTGCVFARDRDAIAAAMLGLRHAAG